MRGIWRRCSTSVDWKCCNKSRLYCVICQWAYFNWSRTVAAANEPNHVGNTHTGLKQAVGAGCSHESQLDMWLLVHCKCDTIGCHHDAMCCQASSNCHSSWTACILDMRKFVLHAQTYYITTAPTRLTLSQLHTPTVVTKHFSLTHACQLPGVA